MIRTGVPNMAEIYRRQPDGVSLRSKNFTGQLGNGVWKAIGKWQPARDGNSSLDVACKYYDGPLSPAHISILLNKTSEHTVRLRNYVARWLVCMSTKDASH